MANQFHNNTDLTETEIGKLAFIGRTVNGWRQRNIDLYQHPTDASRVVAIGTTFDGRMTVVTDDSREDWSIALDYIVHGKIYRSE